MHTGFLQRNKSLIIYGVAMALLLFLLRWLELRLIIIDHAFEIYAGIIALLFTGLGIWLALKLAKPKTVVVEKEVIIERTTPFMMNDAALGELNISKRELEVLELMAKGLSNQEIAAQLFVSLSTIKTHSSRILEKLDVKRRTQAVEKAKRLNIIP